MKSPHHKRPDSSIRAEGLELFEINSESSQKRGLNTTPYHHNLFNHVIILTLLKQPTTRKQNKDSKTIKEIIQTFFSIKQTEIYFEMMLYNFYSFITFNISSHNIELIKELKPHIISAFTIIDQFTTRYIELSNLNVYLHQHSSLFKCKSKSDILKRLNTYFNRCSDDYKIQIYNKMKSTMEDTRMPTFLNLYSSLRNIQETNKPLDRFFMDMKLDTDTQAVEKFQQYKQNISNIHTAIIFIKDTLAPSPYDVFQSYYSICDLLTLSRPLDINSLLTDLRKPKRNYDRFYHNGFFETEGYDTSYSAELGEENSDEEDPYHLLFKSSRYSGQPKPRIAS